MSNDVHKENPEHARSVGAFVLGFPSARALDVRDMTPGGADRPKEGDLLLRPSSDHLTDLARAFAERRRLSSRETEVFTRFVLEGKASKTIAADLGIAYPTVKLYWTRIYKKLGCGDSIAVLVAFLRDCLGAFHCEACAAGRGQD
jgi:DNA-binding CsgD family transcriptional regulator